MARQVNGLRRELATLLATGKEESARIKVEGVLREMNLQVVLEVCELFCELLTVRQRQLEADKCAPFPPLHSQHSHRRPSEPTAAPTAAPTYTAAG